MEEIRQEQQSVLYALHGRIGAIALITKALAEGVEINDELVNEWLDPEIIKERVKHYNPTFRTTVAKEFTDMIEEITLNLRMSEPRD